MSAQEQKVICLGSLVPPRNDSKRIGVELRNGGGRSLLLLVGNDGTGFGSKTKILRVIGKNPVPVQKDTLLGESERLLEIHAGAGASVFYKFSLMGENDMKAELQRLG